MSAAGVHHTQTDYRFAPIPEELLYDPTLSHLAVRIYGCLQRHGLTPESCFPSHVRIARFVSCSKGSVATPIRLLEQAGWIARVPRFKDDGSPDTNGYFVYSRRREAGTPEQGVPAPEQGGVPAPEQGGTLLQNAPKESNPTREIDTSPVTPTLADGDAQEYRPPFDMLRDNLDGRRAS